VTVPKFRGVYKDAKGRWYFKASTHKDPLSGKWTQVTRRGFATERLGPKSLFDYRHYLVDYIDNIGTHDITYSPDGPRAA